MGAGVPIVQSRISGGRVKHRGSVYVSPSYPYRRCLHGSQAPIRSPKSHTWQTGLLPQRRESVCATRTWSDAMPTQLRRGRKVSTLDSVLWVLGTVVGAVVQAGSTPFERECGGRLVARGRCGLPLNMGNCYWCLRPVPAETVSHPQRPCSLQRLVNVGS